MKKLSNDICRCRPLQEVCELAQTCERFLAPISQMYSTVADCSAFPKVDGVCDFYIKVKAKKQGKAS